MKITLNPALTVNFQCLYSSSVTVKSDEFSVTGVSAAGMTTNDSGSLAGGFALQLFTDKKETTLADATNVMIGLPLYGRMKWSVTSVTSVHFFIDSCSLKSKEDQFSVQFIRSNCYSTTLGTQQLQENKLVPTESRFQFVSFIIGDIALEMAATVECTVILCLKGDSLCEEKVITKDDQCPSKDDLSLAGFKYKANTFKQT